MSKQKQPIEISRENFKKSRKLYHKYCQTVDVEPSKFQWNNILFEKGIKIMQKILP